MSFVVYGTQEVRVILRSAVGTDDQRITFGCVSRSGLEIAFEPLGVDGELGSGAGWLKTWSGRRWRARLTLDWSHSQIDCTLETSVENTWSNPQAIETAEAVIRVLNLAVIYPCLVSPHLDDTWSFEALPEAESVFTLRDVKGVFHIDQKLVLVSQMAVDLPDWSA